MAAQLASHGTRLHTTHGCPLLPAPAGQPTVHRPPKQVAASAAIPLRGLLSQRRLSGAWRLKEATAGVVEADRLDLGRATVQLAWCGLFCVCGRRPGPLAVRVRAWVHSLVGRMCGSCCACDMLCHACRSKRLVPLAALRRRRFPLQQPAQRQQAAAEGAGGSEEDEDEDEVPAATPTS